ncbi:MAG: glycosyltransferase family 9 protein, partial [Thiotrichales bacterium]|nr:glycosyltransferase family 9 protein [Thiotrichales bacterium]
LSGIDIRIGNHPRFPYTVHPPGPYTGTDHIFKRMNEILSAAGITPAGDQVYLPVRDAGRQQVKRWLETHGLYNRSFIVLHAGASARHPEKCWPYYRELAQACAERDMACVWIGSAHDQAINRVLAALHGVDATGSFSIPQLGELARHARCAITNDSGPMHALSAGGVPVYGFFGPTNWRRNHALGQQQHVITLQPDNISGKKITDPAYQLNNIRCTQVIDRLQSDGIFS